MSGVFWNIVQHVLCGILILIIMFCCATTGVSVFVPQSFKYGIDLMNMDLDTGDLLVSEGSYCRTIHPGHLALVIRHPKYNQLLVFSHDTQSKQHVLIPLSTYIHHNQLFNQVYALRLQSNSNHQSPRPTFQQIQKIYLSKSSVAYNYHSILIYVHMILHEFLGLPSVVHLLQIIVPSSSQTRFYCADVVIHIMIALNILHPDILTSFTHHGLFLPKLISHNLSAFNNYMLHDWYYENPVPVIVKSRP